MWQQQQQQQAYLRSLPSQHPQQQTFHSGIIGTDDRAHQSHHQHHHQHHRATIMDMPVPSNPRASRNMAEKQRRDNLNTNISTMAALVPIVAGSSRRMDKISILRLAAAFLRTQYILGRRSTNFLPRQFNEFDLEQYFVDHIVDSGGFFLVVTASGKIVYVSRQVEQHLGHVQNVNRRSERKRKKRGQRRAITISRGCSCSCNTDLPCTRGVRNYRSNECVQRKYAPMATVCPLLLFARYERTYLPISVFVSRICTWELPARLLAKKDRMSIRAFRDEK